MSKLGGKSRRTKACRDWSARVIERDGGKCTECDETKKLHAHHIVPWNESEELRFDLDNGRTLCLSCHTKVERQENPRDAWNKDKKLSPEHRKALSISHMGQKAWNKGIEYVLEKERDCRICNIRKDITDFTPQGKYYTRMCKLCRNKLLSDRRLKRKEKICLV